MTRTRTRTWKAVAALGTAALIMITAGVAVAHTSKFPSTVEVTDYKHDGTGNQNDITVKGFVGSDGPLKCEQKRTVKFYSLFGNKYKYQGHAKTNKAGIFKFKHLDFKRHGVVSSGDKVKVRKRIDKSSHHSHVCKSAVERNGATP